MLFVFICVFGIYRMCLDKFFVFIAFFLSILVIIALYLGITNPVFLTSRRLSPLLPLLLFICAYGIFYLKNKWKFLFLLIIFVASGVTLYFFYSYPGHPHADGWREALYYIRQNEDKKDQILILPLENNSYMGQKQFKYYYQYVNEGTMELSKDYNSGLTYWILVQGPEYGVSLLTTEDFKILEEIKTHRHTKHTFGNTIIWKILPCKESE